jgi:hypothetical protein
MDNLGAFLAYILTPPLTYEIVILVGFIIILNLKRLLHRSLKRFEPYIPGENDR